MVGLSNKRASQAELVLVEAGDLTDKPENMSWEVAGSVYVVGVTAWGAVRSVELKEGETVVISGAAGGVGSLAVQLARRTGATVIGLASESNHAWLKSHGVIPVDYGVKTDGGASAGPGAQVLAELATLIAYGQLELPIANVYPPAQVREAYTELERRHSHGKIVLKPELGL